MKQTRRHTDLTVEAALTGPQVAEYLEQLAAALKSGAVHVHAGAHELVLGPRDVLGLKLRARQKAKRQKLVLELTWRKKQVSPDESLPLEFRAAPPETAPEAIEVVDLADATEIDGGPTDSAAGSGPAGSTASKGEAHEGDDLGR